MIFLARFESVSKESMPKSFSVAASPFNATKLGLGIVLLLAICLLFLLPGLHLSLKYQLIILFGYSAIACLILARRVRIILRQARNGQQK